MFKQYGSIALTFLGIIFALVMYQVYLTGGSYVYGLDDTYIHLAVAKNFSQHGVWGISPFEYSATSSSPLFTLILSGLMFIFGVNKYLPLIITSVFGLSYVWLIFSLFKRTRMTTGSSLILVLFLFALPLPWLTLVGMEHLPHIFFITLFLHFVYRYFETNYSKYLTNAIIAITIATGFRYESLFMIAAFAPLFFYKKKYQQVILMGGVASLPVLIIGVISILYGGSFLPNSLLIKTGLTTGKSITDWLAFNVGGIYPKSTWELVTMLIGILPAVLLINVMFLVVAFRQGSSQLLKGMLLSSVILYFIHNLFGGYLQLRHEAYLVAVSLFNFVLVMREIPVTRFFRPKLFFVTTFLLLIPLGVRVEQSFDLVGGAGKNIHDMHLTLRDFTWKNGFTKVSIVDIGVLGYYTDVHHLDPIGLGNNRISKLRRDGQLKRFSDYSDTLHHFNPNYIALYEPWYNWELPESITKVGAIAIKKNVVAGSDTLSLYALQGNAESLRVKWREFRDKNPEKADMLIVK